MESKIDNVIYYSVALKGFDELDFKDDALAGVRSCYFESNFKTQQGDAIRQFDKEKYSYCYCLEENKPMLWKVFKNQTLVQSSKYLPENLYCICFYNSAEIVTKKVYFNQKHYWIKTEYFSSNRGNDCVCSVAPKIINGYFALVKTIYDEKGCVASPLYMVTSMPSVDLCEAVAYSQKGMLYFTSQSPSGVSKNNSSAAGFTFTPNDFNLARNLNCTFDISFAPFLNDENGNPVDKQISNNEDVYSSDKEIFSSTDTSEESEEITEDVPDTFEEYDEIPDFAAEEISDNVSDDEDNSNESSLNFTPDDENYQVSEKPAPDKLIDDGQDKFTYYGKLDENGRRIGYGRTETSQGKTAYEGEYKDDMRNGFGSFYYKDGSINYIGDWSENKRQGRGVGFRSSDGEIHIGKWNNNVPEAMGARFDKNGNFISLNNYVNGRKNGIGISFDEKGNLVLTKWENNREVESQIIILGEDYG